MYLSTLKLTNFYFALKFFNEKLKLLTFGMKNQEGMKTSRLTIICLFSYFILSSCIDKPGSNEDTSGLSASITPDYSGVVIPPGIAPLSFRINVPGNAYFVKFKPDSGENIEIASADGKIMIPLKQWKLFTSKNPGKEFTIEKYVKNEKGWVRFNDVKNRIASEPIDPYLYYRIIYPGYESWAEMSINMRQLSDFKTNTIIDNGVAEDNCINCHSFNNGKTDDFLFHMRGSLGGTYFYNGYDFKKVNLKTSEMKNSAVYPRWHPSGKYVAFSSNKIIQRFHSATDKKVEVSDLESSLVLYDVDKNEMSELHVPDNERYMDTYPEWSPDGKYIYFCRAFQIADTFDYTTIRYNIYRMDFDILDKSTGEPELVFDAESLGKSASFPRISPDGRFLCFTLSDYGCFPTWHKEADLWMTDLSKMTSSRSELNSDFSESYHSWSSNSRWLVFSSKRDDGRTARPYISFIDESGKASKPFVLPQKDPDFYGSFLKSFNIPEFANNRVRTNPGIIRKASYTRPIQARWQTNTVKSLLPVDK